MNKAIIITLCFIFLQSYTTKPITVELKGGKDVPCTLYMEDGSTKKGLVAFPLKSGANSITLKSNGTKEKVDLENVKKVIFEATTVNFAMEYYNLPVYNFNGKKIQNHKQMLKLYIAGKKVSLYTGTFDWSGYANAGNGFQGFSYSGLSYYCMKPEEPAATLIHEDFGEINKNADFKLYASRYFADYPELVQKIKDKVYTYKNIDQVVEDYNNH